MTDETYKKDSILVCYTPLDFGIGDTTPEYVCTAGSLAEARNLARLDAEKNGRILSSYTWERSGKLFP